MKKLFSVVLTLMLVISLSACNNSALNEKMAEIKTLQQEIASLEEDASTKDALIEDYETQIAELEAEVAALQNQIYDNIITITYEDYYGDYRSQALGYDDTFSGNLFELLDSEFDITANDTEYGKTLISFEHLSPLNGAYIAFYKNGNPSMVGVESASFEHGDVFDFKIEYWDAFEQQVDDAIQLFLTNHVNDYINDTTYQYYVVTALSLLDELDNYTTSSDVVNYVEGLTLDTYANYFKAIALLNASGNDASSYISDLASIATTGPYGQTAYTLIALNSAETPVDYTSFETSALDYFSNNTPYDVGIDTGAVDLIALAKYTDESGVETLINDYLTWIETDQLDNGGVMTRDMGWGSTLNASSLSQIIIAMIANDINPRSATYTTNNNTLIDALLLFQTDTGSFDWVLTDDTDEDLAFSTPQAFLALVMYQVYSNEGTAIQPFDAA
ncbi:MAG: hypothetical protein K9L26_00480 [Candidatus Izimaplasma sp.]|nr:hypothetical protein [Candidatus Izimaplasma bacterium]